VLEEDQAERDMFVVRRLHVATQLVGSLEEFSLETEVATISVGFRGLWRRGRNVLVKELLKRPFNLRGRLR
jgi:hypothetical protein